MRSSSRSCAFRKLKQTQVFWHFGCLSDARLCAGHTIGTHSQHHPHFERLSMQRVEREVDGGINSVTAALGDAKALSPFFRIPYLGRTNAIERFLEGKQLVTWSAEDPRATPLPRIQFRAACL